MTLRPFFPFYGSKWNLARYYPAPAGRVVEPFAGAAGYSTFYGVADVSLYDVDPVLIGLWNYLIAVSPAEIMALPELPGVGDSVDNYALPQEAKWLIGFWLNRGSASPKKSRTAYSARTDRAQLNWGLRAKERIASQVGSIRGWSATLASYDKAPEVEATWFVDPPYVDKGRFYSYPFEGYSSLGEWCLSRSGRVIVCEGPGADWLPFSELGTFKTSKGSAREYAFVLDANEGLTK